MLQKIPWRNRRLEAVEVRTPEELKRCDALIIPGGGLPSSLPFFFTADQENMLALGATVRVC